MNNISKLNKVKNKVKNNDIEMEISYKDSRISIYIKRSSSDICMPEIFKINDIDASIFDFGNMRDLDKDNAPSCGCGNRSYVPKVVTKVIMDKYSLNESTLMLLQLYLTKHLHIGKCKRCL